MKHIALFGFMLSAIMVAVYLFMTRVDFPPAVKWALLALQLLLAGLGLLAGTWAMIKRQWVGLVTFGVCAYFLWFQLLA